MNIIKKGTIEKIIETPHTPTLTLIRENDNKTKTIRTIIDNKIHDTKENIQAKIVDGYYCFTEEELYHPVAKWAKENNLKLNCIEIDTKILKFLYSNKDFNAYSIDDIGMGLNVDYLTRISGKLYKIETKKQ
jgi:hypothetical protein